MATVGDFRIHNKNDNKNIVVSITRSAVRTEVVSVSSTGYINLGLLNDFTGGLAGVTKATTFPKLLATTGAN